MPFRKNNYIISTIKKCHAFIVKQNKKTNHSKENQKVKIKEIVLRQLKPNPYQNLSNLLLKESKLIRFNLLRKEKWGKLWKFKGLLGRISIWMLPRKAKLRKRWRNRIRLRLFCCYRVMLRLIRSRYLLNCTPYLTTQQTS